MHNARMTMPNPFLTMPMPAWQRLTEQPDGLSESPFWHAQESRLYWVDIPGRRIGRMRVQGLDQLQAEPPEYWDLPEEPGCLAPVAREDGGGLVLARRDGVFRARAWGGAWELLAPAPYDTTRLRFNDGKCDPRGRLWVGTMYEPRGQSLGVLYRLDRQAGGYQLQPMAHGAIVANGLAWSPDARTLYWSCTGHHQVRAWQFDADSGTLAAERVFQSLPKKARGLGLGRRARLRGAPRRRQRGRRGRVLVGTDGGRLPQAFCPRRPPAADRAHPGAVPDHALLWRARWAHPVHHQRQRRPARA